MHYLPCFTVHNALDFDNDIRLLYLSCFTVHNMHDLHFHFDAVYQVSEFS